MRDYVSMIRILFSLQDLDPPTCVNLKSPSSFCSIAVSTKVVRQLTIQRHTLANTLTATKWRWKCTEQHTRHDKISNHKERCFITTANAALELQSDTHLSAILTWPHPAYKQIKRYQLLAWRYQSTSETDYPKTCQCLVSTTDPHFEVCYPNLKSCRK